MQKENLATLPSYAESHMQRMYDIAEVQQHFLKGSIAYTEGIHRFNIEIKKLQNSIEWIEKTNQNDEEALLALESEISYDEKVLSRLNDRFMLKIKSLEELKSEYKEIVSDDDYATMYHRKKEAVSEILDEIETFERTLYSRELQRINLLKKLAPIRQELKNYKHNLKNLLLEKGHFESTQIHQVLFRKRLTKQGKNKNISF